MNTLENASKMENELLRLIDNLYKEGQLGLAGAIIQSAQQRIEILSTHQKEKAIQEITNDTTTTQKIMNELFGSYGKYTPLIESEKIK